MVVESFAKVTVTNRCLFANQFHAVLQNVHTNINRSRHGIYQYGDIQGVSFSCLRYVVLCTPESQRLCVTPPPPPFGSVSTVSSVDPLSDQQIGYIALDEELQEVAAGATCLLNHNFSLSPIDGPGHDNIDQAVARLSAVSLSNSAPEGKPAGVITNGERGAAAGGHKVTAVANGVAGLSAAGAAAAAGEGLEPRTPVAETPPAAPGLQ